MIDRFIFPVMFTDLEKESDIHEFKVLSTTINEPDARIIKHLNDMDKQIFQNYRAIAENQFFDVMYALIKGFSESIEFRNSKVLEKLADTVHMILKTVLKEAHKVTSIPEEGNSDIRIAFKMAIYISLFFIYSTTIKKAKGQTDLIGDMLNKEKKKKPKNDSVQVSQTTVSRQKMIVELLKETLYVNYEAIFEKRQVDSEFFKKYCEISVKIMESNLVKDQDILNVIFQILETIIKAQPELFNNIRIVLINLVYESEIIDNLVNFFSRAESAELQRLCTETIITVVIYLVQKSGLSAEASSIKNTKEFLSKLSQRLPKVFYNNLQCFIKLYEHESYLLRNAISDILFNIIRNVLNIETEENKKAKERFITTLLQRIYDKNSHCRTYVINILMTLAEQKLVPRKYMTLFLKAGIDRVKDSSINVRKKALQLINTIIDSICKDEVRTLEIIEKELELSQLTLKTLAEQENSLKIEIDNLEDEDRIEELIGEMKLLKKNIKHEEEKQIALLEEKEVLNLIDITINNVKLLLGSKQESDVLETIRLFVKLYRLKFQKAMSILPQIRLLIFSKEQKIRDQVLNTFVHLHLTKKSDEVARQMTTLFTQAIVNNKEDLLSLEETLEIIITKSIEKNYIVIKPHVYAHMWNQFIQYERNDSNVEEKRAIVTVLRTAFTKDPNLIKDENMDSFLNILKKYIENQDADFYLVKQISKIVCLQHQKIVRVSKNFLVALIFILVNCLGSNDNEWYSACENVLTCIFKISQNPQKLSELFLKKLHQKLEKLKTQKGMAQFMFTLSHSCLKTLIHLDAIQNKIKAIKIKQGNREQEMQEQLDKVMGGVEAQLQKKIEAIQLLSEKILDDPFIKKWVQVIEDVVKKFQTGNQLEVISVLSYCKFMCLSPSYCERKIQPILDLLIKPNINSVVKNNIIIAMGDLLHRFPNIVEPYNHYLYRNLQDKDVGVRKTTLTVLTHLSLNDMIKVRSDLCDIALLFKDGNQEIEGLVKQFFFELNKKDPKIIFNLIPDALSKFSSEKYEDASTFVVFLQNITPMMEKQKYSESLIQKLCERLSNSLNLLQIRNAAFCLGELSINEKGLRKILENFESFKKTLENTEVQNYFKTLVHKLKKFPKAQIKPLIDELQQKVNIANDEVFNPEEIRRKNIERLNPKEKRGRKPAVLNKSMQKKSDRKVGKRRNRMREEDDSDEEEFMEEEYEETGLRNRQKSQREENSNNNSRNRSEEENARNNRPKRNKAKMQIIEEDEEDEDEYEYEEDN